MGNNYQDYGFENRREYLKDLANTYEVDYSQVRMIADLLGPEEDFDGLVVELEDFSEMYR